MRTFLNCAAVGVILFVLAGVIIPSTGGPSGSADRPRTLILMTQLAAALELYVQEYGSLPPSSENYRVYEALTKGNPRKLSFYSPAEKELNVNREGLDAWGCPLRFIFSTASTSFILSAGKDGIFDTKDDLKSEFQRVAKPQLLPAQNGN